MYRFIFKAKRGICETYNNNGRQIFSLNGHELEMVPQGWLLGILEPKDNGKTIRKIHHFCHKHDTYIGEEHSNSIKKQTGADEYTNNTSIDTCFHNRPQKTGKHSEGQLP